MIHQAYYNLYPEVVSVDEGLGPLDVKGNPVTVDDILVQQESDRLEVYEQTKAYQLDREMNYPTVGDQLDALYHAGVFPVEMQDQIKAIKDKYPKGE